jgi:NADH-quinone oxidoreductase subunit L
VADWAESLHEEIHSVLVWVSAAIALAGIALAAYFHWLRPEAAERAAVRFAGIVRVLANKYYVDELYDAVIVTPLRRLGEVLYLVDRLVIDGLVAAVGLLPRALGLAAQPAQRGALQGYGLGMVAGAAVVTALIFWALR